MIKTENIIFINKHMKTMKKWKLCAVTQWQKDKLSAVCKKIIFPRFPKKEKLVIPQVP